MHSNSSPDRFNNATAQISPAARREFALSVASVGDTTGIILAALVGLAVEPWLCNQQPVALPCMHSD